MAKRKITVYRSAKKFLDVGSSKEDIELMLAEAEMHCRGHVHYKKFITLRDILDYMNYDYEKADLLLGYEKFEDISIKFVELKNSNPTAYVIEIKGLVDLFAE